MHASRKRLVRKITLFGLALATAVQGCDSSDEKLTAAQLAEGCSLDSDCQGDLVCVFEHCHVECNDDKDCDAGRCVRVPAEDREKSSTVGVCQLSTEASCNRTSECKGDQVCTVDRQCRDECDSTNPCFPGFVCAVNGGCALPVELDSNGGLRSGAGGVGNTDGTGGGSAGAGAETASGGASQGGSGGASSTDGGTTGVGGSGGDGGGNIASTGGAASGGTSATGGNGNGAGASAGDNSLGGGGAQGVGGGGAGEAGAAGAGNGTDSYVEETNAAEPVQNNDREHSLPLPKQGSLWLPAADQDWFYIDVPDDGRAHVIEVLVRQTANQRAYVRAFAALDNSQIGQILVPEATTRSVFVTVGPGTRTQLAFVCDSPGRLDFELVGVTAERDDHEPNNDRYTAKTVALNTAITGQQIVPYTKTGGIDVSDWYQVTLAAGPATVNVVDVPANVGLSITMMDDTNLTTAVKKFLPGVIGTAPVTITKAGVYRFQLNDHSNSSLAAFFSGTKPESLEKTYTVRFEQ